MRVALKPDRTGGDTGKPGKTDVPENANFTDTENGIEVGDAEFGRYGGNTRGRNLEDTQE